MTADKNKNKSFSAGILKPRFFVLGAFLAALFFLWGGLQPALAVDGLMNGKTITGETDDFLLWLQTYDSNTAPYFFDKFFINKTGNVGIGITNPVYKLDVSGTGQFTQPVIVGTPTGATHATTKSYVDSLLAGGSGSTVGYWAMNGTNISNSNSGNVGVGTTSPAQKLQISGGSIQLDNNRGVFSYDTSGGVVNAFHFNNANNFIFGYRISGSGDFPVRFYTGSSERMRISADGNVGIGTTAPNASLDIYNGALVNRTANINHYRNVLMSYLGNGAQTGTLKIVLPKEADTMMDITIKGYDYTGIGAWEARVSGYVYSGTGGGWYTGNHKAQIIGSAPFSQIRLAFDGSKPVILLGNTSTVWSYGSVEITDVSTTFNNITDWGTGWSSSLVASEAGLTTIATPTIYTYTNSIGNVGIALTNPVYKLDVSGTGQFTQPVLVGTPTANSHAVTKSYVDSLLGAGSYLPLTGGALSGGLNMGGNNITNINKLTVTTIDPLYNIKGINYSTFASAIAGGVKEEYVGKGKIAKKNSQGEYEAVIDFDNQEEGSDLWVWHKTVDFSDDNVQVLLTPSGKSAQVYYLISGNKLILRADKAVTVSYRLIGRRVDWRNWPTKATDQTEKASFIIK